MADFQSNNQRLRQRIKKSSSSRSKRVQKGATHFTSVAKQILQGGQVWENEEQPSGIFLEKERL